MPRAWDDLGPNPFRYRTTKKSSGFNETTASSNINVSQPENFERDASKPSEQQAFVLPRRGLQSHRWTANTNLQTHDRLPDSPSRMDKASTKPRAFDHLGPSPFGNSRVQKSSMPIEATVFSDPHYNQPDDRRHDANKPFEHTSFVPPHRELYSDGGSAKGGNGISNNFPVFGRGNGNPTPTQAFPERTPPPWEGTDLGLSPFKNHIQLEGLEIEIPGSFPTTDLGEVSLEPYEVIYEPSKGHNLSHTPAEVENDFQNGRHATSRSFLRAVLDDLDQCDLKTRGPQPFLRTGLGKVPPEIRETIWEYVLLASTAQKSERHFTSDSVPVGTVSATASSSSPPHTSRLAILLTCRLVYNETRRIFYTNNTFHFTSASNLLAFLRNTRFSCRKELRFLYLGGLVDQRPCYSERRLNNVCRQANLSTARREELASLTYPDLHPDGRKAAKILSACKNLNKITVDMKAGHEQDIFCFLSRLGSYKGIVVDFTDEVHWVVKPAKREEQHEWLETTLDLRMEGYYPMKDRMVEITVTKGVMRPDSLDSHNDSLKGLDLDSD